MQVEKLKLEKANVWYIRGFLDEKEARDMYDWCLENLPFAQYKVNVFGWKDQPRLTCALGNTNMQYSGAEVKTVEIPERLSKIMNRINNLEFGSESSHPRRHAKYNCILCNYY